MSEQYILPEEFDGSRCWSTPDLRTQIDGQLKGIDGLTPEGVLIVLEALECFAWNEQFVLDEPLIREMTGALGANLPILKEARGNLSLSQFVEMIILALSRCIDRHKPRILRNLKHKELDEKLSKIEGMTREDITKTLNGIVALETHFNVPVSAEDIQYYIDFLLPELPDAIRKNGSHAAMREAYSKFFGYMKVQKPEAAMQEQVRNASMN